MRHYTSQSVLQPPKHWLRNLSALARPTFHHTQTTQPARVRVRSMRTILLALADSTVCSPRSARVIFLEFSLQILQRCAPQHVHYRRVAHDLANGLPQRVLDLEPDQGASVWRAHTKASRRAPASAADPVVPIACPADRAEVADQPREFIAKTGVEARAVHAALRPPQCRLVARGGTAARRRCGAAGAAAARPLRMPLRRSRCGAFRPAPRLGDLAITLLVFATRSTRGHCISW